MVSFRRMLPSDALAVCLQDAQARFSELVQHEDYRTRLAEGPVAWTCHEGAAIHAVGGIVPQWDAPHLGRAWALIGASLPASAWVPATRFVSETLAAALDRFEAIETEVDLAHGEGHRWAHLLGFRLAGLRPYRNGATRLPAAAYVFTQKPQDGIPVSVGAALDFLDRVVASWLRHAPGTDPQIILKDAWPRRTPAARQEAA